MNKPLRLNRRALEKQTEQREAKPLPTRPGGLSRAEGLLNAVVPQNDTAGYVREISRLWNEAKDKFLAIGEYLSLAKGQLAHGEYEAMIRSQLPFGKSAAHRMRAVAEAVRNGRLTRDSLPQSYATAYELTLLNDEQLRLAQDRGLVRCDVYRSEIVAFRRTFDNLSAVDGRQGELLREWHTLGIEIRRLQQQLRRATDRRLDIEREIGPSFDHLGLRQRDQVPPNRAEAVEEKFAPA
jgi:hypothetical protein